MVCEVWVNCGGTIIPNNLCLAISHEIQEIQFHKTHCKLCSLCDTSTADSTGKMSGVVLLLIGLAGLMHGNRFVLYTYTCINHHTNSIINFVTVTTRSLLFTSYNFILLYFSSFMWSWCSESVYQSVQQACCQCSKDGSTSGIIRWQFGLWTATFWSRCDTGRWINMVGSQR